MTALKLAEMATDCGLPPGVLNMIHGTHEAVNFICDNEHVKAISFVGGNQAGEHIYNRASANHKRAQCNMGAKNHAVILPDADAQGTVNQLIGAAMGAAGQRCMGISVAIFVGKAKDSSRDSGTGSSAGTDSAPGGWSSRS